MSLLCIVAKNVCRFVIMHVKLVFEGGLANLHDMVWATCMHGIVVYMVSFVVLSIASESAIHVVLPSKFLYKL